MTRTRPCTDQTSATRSVFEVSLLMYLLRPLIIYLSMGAAQALLSILDSPLNKAGKIKVRGLIRLASDCTVLALTCPCYSYPCVLPLTRY